MDVREKSRKFALWFCAGATRFFHVLARQARGIVQVHEIFIAATENGAGIQYAVIRITNRDIRRRERGTGTYHTRKEFLRLCEKIWEWHPYTIGKEIFSATLGVFPIMSSETDLSAFPYILAPIPRGKATVYYVVREGTLPWAIFLLRIFSNYFLQKFEKIRITVRKSDNYVWIFC